MSVRIITGDVRDVLPTLPAESVHCCVTSPPYWGLRDYGAEGQLGLEKTPDEYVAAMVAVFREVRRVLRADGTLWLNLGDSYLGGGGGNYGGTSKSTATHAQHLTNVRNRRGFIEAAGLKPKDLVGIPWRVAFALQADGWWLRSEIIWAKPNPMPESVTDRPTKAHEQLFLLAKSARYFYDADEVREAGTGVPWNSARSTLAANGIKNVLLNKSGQRRTAGSDTHHDDVDRTGRNRRTVWTVASEPYRGAHFAVMPTALVEPCVKAGCPVGGTVLDPFSGAGTVALVADRLQRHAIGIELNPAYADMARERVRADAPLLAAVER
jgi:DNA modification methylase